MLTADCHAAEDMGTDVQSTVVGNFIKALAAVLGGNAIYFLLLAPRLPPAARHSIFRLDWGLVIDFWVCVAVYGVIELLWRRKTGRTDGR